jgi:hypothetical protein
VEKGKLAGAENFVDEDVALFAVGPLVRAVV